MAARMRLKFHEIAHKAIYKVQIKFIPHLQDWVDKINLNCNDHNYANDSGLCWFLVKDSVYIIVITDSSDDLSNPQVDKINADYERN